MVQMYDTTVDEKSEAVMPRFYYKSVEDRKGSEEAGHPLFKEVEWIEMRIRGDNTTVIDRAVSDAERERFASSYRAFKEGKEQKYGNGLPLEQWPAMSTALVDMWNAQQVYTVEQLSGLPDTIIHKIRGGQTWKQKAIRWLSERGGYEQEISDLKSQVAELTKLLKDKPVRKKRGPGRPRKVRPAAEE